MQFFLRFSVSKIQLMKKISTCSVKFTRTVCNIALFQFSIVLCQRVNQIYQFINTSKMYGESLSIQDCQLILSLF